MARSVETDPFHDFRFHIVDPAGGNLDAVAGFTNVGMPDITVEEANYREGTHRWTRKFPGIQSVGNVTMTKGIFRRESDFFNWVKKVIDGGQDYRSDLIVQEFHITDEFGIAGSPSRVTRLLEVWGQSAKPTSDKDATSSAVSLQNLTLSVEEIQVEVIDNT